MVSGRNLNNDLSFHVLVTCKKEDDSIKNEGARVVTTFSNICLWRFFQTLKGSLLCSPKSDLAEFPTRSRCNNLMFSLPARIEKIRSKMKELEWLKDYPHYQIITRICCHENQSSKPIWPKT